jgi:hypothetical protein
MKTWPEIPARADVEAVVRDLSWLDELKLGDFSWGDSNHFYVEIVHRGQVSELLLGFWVKPVDEDWAVSGPSTLW